MAKMKELITNLQEAERLLFQARREVLRTSDEAEKSAIENKLLAGKNAEAVLEFERLFDEWSAAKKAVLQAEEIVNA